MIQAFTMVYTSIDVLNDLGTKWLSIPLLIGLSMYMYSGVDLKRWLTKSARAVSIVSCVHYSGGLLLSRWRADAVKMRCGFDQHGKYNLFLSPQNALLNGETLKALAGAAYSGNLCGSTA